MITEVAFKIILHAGNGKSKAMEAIQKAKLGQFKQAETLLEKAGEELVEAHQFQTKLLQKEASGEQTPINLMLIHSQDHLMTAMTVRDLAREFIELYEQIN